MAHVSPSEKCIARDVEGKECKLPTGMTEPGEDADLCPDHRAVMAAQREAVLSRPTLEDRLAAIEARLAALEKPK